MIDVFFSAEYGKLNETIENGTCEIYNYQDEYGLVRHTFIKRKIEIPLNNTEYFDIVSPYGYGGPVIIESVDKKKLIEAYYKDFSNYTLKNNIVSEFVRFHLFDNTELREHFYGETVHISTNIIRVLNPPLDQIWMEFEPKVRKNVKRALLKNLKVIVDTEGIYLSDFLNIFYSTLDRNVARKYYYFPAEYFEEMNNVLKGQYAYFHVCLDNKIISTELVLFSEKYVYSFLGGTNAEFYDYRPNDILKFEIIKWAKETDKELFILGGGYSENDGISRYKRSFAPSGVANFYIGRKIHNPEVYNDLVKIRKQEESFNTNTKYFPTYRG